MSPDLERRWKRIRIAYLCFVSLFFLFVAYRGEIEIKVYEDIEAIDPLITILIKDENYYFREKAAETLGKIKDSRAVKPLIVTLKDENWRVRDGAARALGEIGNARAVEPLIKTLNDESSYVREAAEKALGKIDPNWPKSDEAKRQVPEFIAALKDKDSDVQKVAVDTLEKIGDPRAVNPLITALKDKNPDVREAVAEALGKFEITRARAWSLVFRHKWNEVIKLKEAVEPLIAALKDKDSVAQWSVVVALGKIGDARTVEPLITALKNDRSIVRGEAAEALGKIGDPLAVEPLIAILKDRDWRVSRKAAEALGKIGNAKAIKPLEELAQHDSVEAVRQAAKEALAKIRR